MQNEYFLESVIDIVNERIPERIVHPKGSGALGHFEVTRDTSHICKANFLQTVGKRTPVTVRFSTANLERGSADTLRGPRGFSMKFYTEDGNFDIIAFNTEMFSLKDPVKFASNVRSHRRNPATNFQDVNVLWDFITLNPEIFFINMLVFHDRGISDGYRYMPGFAIHTYEVQNEENESHFVRFHFIPDAGIRNLNSSEGVRLAGIDPDYAGRDLFNAIDKGDFPTWTVSLQILTPSDVSNSSFDPFDISRVIPLDKYPLHEIGKLILNKNPVNFQAQVEQLAFCPGNLVPGILGAPDKAFEARRFAYRQAAVARLGSNFNKIPINCPLRRHVWTQNRDGKGPVGDNEGDTPNYYPNSFNGAYPYKAQKAPRPTQIIESEGVNNLDQARNLYQSWPEEEKERMAANVVDSLGGAIPELQKRALNLFTVIDRDLSSRIARGLAVLSIRTSG